MAIYQFLAGLMLMVLGLVWFLLRRTERPIMPLIFVCLGLLVLMAACDNSQEAMTALINY